MLNIRTLVVVVALALMATYAVEHFGFAIAHSMEFLVFAILMAPGTLLAFLNWESGEWVPMMLATVMNGAYYYLLALLLRKLAAAKKGKQ